ncbi:flagellar hook-basal body complex protein [Spartinivicinus ruber]|uniref:flagellar hook-basal body complex protein n=1 Tax=Spartinivicinus ruber TaxID=2683272 RepID=UPI0013D163BB|nr:flagellar hook-basal body complex protein [Spartinivicinus ruber]
MSTLGAIFKSFSGIHGFTRSLDNLSHNLSNINTPGFKGKDVLFRDMASNTEGAGVRHSGEKLRFTQGDIVSTGRDTHLAIDGNGLFVLTDGDKKVFTRAGQFELKNNKLVDSASDLAVQAIKVDNLHQQVLDISAYQYQPPKPTTSISLSGNLKADAPVDSVYPAEDNSSELSFEVYDNQGGKHKFTVSLKKIANKEWQLFVKNSNDVDMLKDANNKIKFNVGGLAIDSKLEFSIKDLQGNDQTIQINIGNGLQGITSLTGAQSKALVKVDDGAPKGDIKSLSFDRHGYLEITYTNNEKVKPYQVLLANVPETQLESIGNGMFAASENAEITYGKPNNGVFGVIRGGSIEQSNINMSKEFAEIVVVQRGYQATAQLINVTSQMLEELYNSTRGR